MRLNRILLMFGMLVLSAPVLLAESKYFTIEEVAPGVFAAIAKPGVACNGAFIITDDGVFVVDTHLRPSWARDLIQAIGERTSLPVRYVINTHWHNDHTQGNQAYLESFPKNTEFISHHYTREDILNQAIPSVKKALETDVPNQIAGIRKQLETGKGPDGQELSQERKMQLQTQLESQIAYLEELRSMQITIPNLSFEKSLIFYKGERQIQILYFGQGHTRGDVVIYLPRERVIITGDLLTGGLPFMRDAIPSAWAGTLEGVGKLDFDKVIGGHGPVQLGKDRLYLTVSYLKDLVAAVQRQVAAGSSLEETRRNVDLSRYEKDFQNFKAGVVGNIDRTYWELTQKKGN